MTSFFTTATPNDPVFFQNFKFFARFARISKICQFSAEMFSQNLHQMTPYFGNFTPKKAQLFWIPHPMTPIFLRNPTPIVPCFFSGRHIPVTFIKKIALIVTRLTPPKIFTIEPPMNFVWFSLAQLVRSCTVNLFNSRYSQYRAPSIISS